MSIVRYIINFEEFVKDLSDSIKNNNDVTLYEKEYEKGFRVTNNENKVEFTTPKDIYIKNIQIGTFGKYLNDEQDCCLDIYVENKEKDIKNFIFENVYIKKLIDNKDLISFFRLNLSETLSIELKGTTKCECFVDIKYSYIDEETPLE